MNKKYHQKYQWGGAMNFFAAIISHIPCCGSKILATVFGLQFIGTFATAYYYPIQICMPIVAGIILTVFYWPVALRNQRAHAGHDHPQLSFRADMTQFFIVNLIIGYAVIAVLYLFVPPHDHHIMTGTGTGYVDMERQVAVLTLPDDKRFFPWHERHFIAHLNAELDEDHGEMTLIAKELPWYRMIWGHAAHDFALGAAGHTPMRLYSRLNGYAILAALSAAPIGDNIYAQTPVKFYLVIPTAAAHP